MFHPVVLVLGYHQQAVDLKEKQLTSVCSNHRKEKVTHTKRDYTVIIQVSGFRDPVS